MSDVWMLGPTALAFGLRRLGFTPTEADRIVALRLRYVRGHFRELTDPHKRVLFARYLVEHGWLNEGIADVDLTEW
jgi:hypothetical protein